MRGCRLCAGAAEIRRSLQHIAPTFRDVRRPKGSLNFRCLSSVNDFSPLDIPLRLETEVFSELSRVFG